MTYFKELKISGNAVLEMLDFYGANGVRELTDEQIKDYEMKHIDDDVKIYKPKGR